MKAKKTERYYVYVCHYWQCRVSKREFFSIIDAIMQDQCYSDNGDNTIPFVLEEFQELYPNGSFHTDYIIQQVTPYSPTGEKGYVHRIYFNSEVQK